ncbi:MAG: hypothetical protein RL432_871 [Bacteroidota bacterium]|jgi:hypothetical protein
MSIKTIDQLTETQKRALKQGVIEVTGKAMNRTALGVVDALLTLYPSLTFEELKSMLPDSINPSAPKNYKSLFKPYTERLYGVVQNGNIRKECESEGLDIHASHFVDSNETFRTSDGIEVLVSRSWESADTATGENDLQKLIDHVAKFGVRVTKVEKKVDFNKGDYHLEIINAPLLKELQQPNKTKFPWWVILVVLAIIGAAAFFLTKK